MGELAIGGLVIAMGVVAAGVGYSVASHRLRAAHRAYRRTAALEAVEPSGWGGWFLDGFSGLGLGTQWLRAGVVWLLWTLAGVGLIGLGLGLFHRGPS